MRQDRSPFEPRASSGRRRRRGARVLRRRRLSSCVLSARDAVSTTFPNDALSCSTTRRRSRVPSPKRSRAPRPKNPRSAPSAFPLRRAVPGRSRGCPRNRSTPGARAASLCGHRSPEFRDMTRFEVTPEEPYARGARSVGPRARDRCRARLARQTRRARSARSSGSSPGARPGYSVFLAARTETQAERLDLARSSPRSCPAAKPGRVRPAGCSTRRGQAARSDASWSGRSRAASSPRPKGWCWSPRRRSSDGARTAPRARAHGEGDPKPFLEDLRALAVGDYVVHVEHGDRQVPRPGAQGHRWAHRRSPRRRVRGRRQALPAGLSPQPDPEVLGRRGRRPSSIASAGRRSRRPRQRVEKQVRQMADELLRLYAERQAQPRRRARRPPTTTTAPSRRPSRSTRPPTRRAPSTR